jgi:hypothetical protein
MPLQSSDGEKQRDCRFYDFGATGVGSREFCNHMDSTLAGRMVCFFRDLRVFSGSLSGRMSYGLVKTGWSQHDCSGPVMPSFVKPLYSRYVADHALRRKGLKSTSYAAQPDRSMLSREDWDRLSDHYPVIAQFQ